MYGDKNCEFKKKKKGRKSWREEDSINFSWRGSQQALSISPGLILRQLYFFFFLTQESTSFRLLEIFEIALSAADEMKIYSWCQ